MKGESKGFGGELLSFFIEFGKTLLSTLGQVLKEAGKMFFKSLKGMRRMMK